MLKVWLPRSHVRREGCERYSWKRRKREKKKKTRREKRYSDKN